MLCDPCKRNYSAIIKQEQFKEETLLILGKVDVKPDIQAEIMPLLEDELVERSVQNLILFIYESVKLFRYWDM